MEKVKNKDEDLDNLIDWITKTIKNHFLRKYSLNGLKELLYENVDILGDYFYSRRDSIFLAASQEVQFSEDFDFRQVGSEWLAYQVRNKFILDQA